MIQHKLNDFYESDSKTEAAHPTAVLSAAQLKLTPPGWLWATGTNMSPGFLCWASSKTQASEKMPSSRNKYTAPCLKSSGARSIGRVLNASLPALALETSYWLPPSLSFLICEGVDVRMTWNHAHQALSTMPGTEQVLTKSPPAPCTPHAMNTYYVPGDTPKHLQFRRSRDNTALC